MRQSTSAEAYYDLLNSGVISELQKQVLTYITEHPNQSAAEIHEFGFKEKFGHAVKPRITELKLMGLVKITGKKICAITGREVHCYQVEANPNKVKKLKQIKKSKKELLALIEWARDMLVDEQETSFIEIADKWKRWLKAVEN